MPSHIIVPDAFLVRDFPDYLKSINYTFTSRGNYIWIYKASDSPLPEVRRVTGWPEIKSGG